jgi:hypothetical protein
MRTSYRKVVVIDTENINDSCAESFDILTEEDLLILMVSETSFKLPIDKAVKLRDLKCELRTIKVRNGQPNAMDFCIVSEIGYLMAIFPGSKFYIISNDHGYRSVVYMWNNKGYFLKLFGSLECLKYPDIENLIVQGEHLEPVIEAQKEKMQAQLDAKELVDTDDETSEKLDIDLDLAFDFDDEDDNKDIRQDENSDIKIDNLDHESEFVAKTASELMSEKIRYAIVNQKLNELTDREYNIYKLRDVGIKFGHNKEKKVVTIILSNVNKNDIDSAFHNIVKKDADKYLKIIKANWDEFKHMV